MKPQDLERWFETSYKIYETAYLSHEEPWRQSGMSGPEDRWTLLRRPVAACVDRPGSFLDVGCANGYLLECLLRWTAEQGTPIDPYGLDISAPLVDLARRRLPQYADRIFVGNAFEWLPPRRFDFVRTELVYVPGEYEKAYLERLLERYLNPGGRLLVANYIEGHPDPRHGNLPENHPTAHILDRLAELGFRAVDYKDGYDPSKDRRVRVAVLQASDMNCN